MYIEPPIDISCDYQGQAASKYASAFLRLRSGGMEMGGVQDYADYMNQYARSSVSWSFMALNLASGYMDTLICPTQILRWISMNVTHAMNLRSAIFK